MDFHDKLIEDGAEEESTTKALKRDARTITFQVNITESNPTACIIEIAGSLDEVKFQSLATHTFTDDELTAGFCLFHIANKPSLIYRITLTTLTGDVGILADVYWGGAHV